MGWIFFGSDLISTFSIFTGVTSSSLKSISWIISSSKFWDSISGITSKLSKSELGSKEKFSSSTEGVSISKSSSVPCVILSWESDSNSKYKNISYKRINNLYIIYDSDTGKTLKSINYVPVNLTKFKNEYEKWIVENGFDLNRVKLITGLIFLNMSPLHDEKFAKMLWFKSIEILSAFNK